MRDDPSRLKTVFETFARRGVASDVRIRLVGARQHTPWVKQLAMPVFVFALSAVAVLEAIPSAPGSLTATVAGSTVTLSWTAPTGALVGYRLEAGTAPGLSDVANVVVGTSTTFSAPAVPAGTYHIRVRAIAVDGESGPSNEVVAVVGGSGVCTTAPAPPTDLVASVSGTAVTFRWSSGGGCVATSYVIHAGTASGLSNLAIVNVGNLLSFSAVLPAGVYYVRVIAQNAFGSSGPSQQATVVVGGITTPLPPRPGAVGGNGAVYTTVTMPASGRYEVTLTWSDPTIDLDLYLATAGCSSSDLQPECLLAISDSLVGTMERVSWTVRAGERFELWIANWSNRATSFSVQHFIATSDERPGSPSVSGEGDMLAPIVIRKSPPVSR